MFKIGIIGLGFVGRAMEATFEHNAEISIADPKYSTLTVEDVAKRKPTVIFVCLPAPTISDGSVDVSAIHDVFNRLNQAKYVGIVVLKSTVPPSVVKDLLSYQGIYYSFIYSPEFLREDHWREDAIWPKIIVFGGEYIAVRKLDKFYTDHSHIKSNPKVSYMGHEEAALLKYSINAYLATKVIFMNQLKEVFNDLIEPSTPKLWSEFVDVMASDERIGSSHMRVPGKHGFGYGGSCFPKDVRAMLEFDKNRRLTVLQEASEANLKIVLKGKNDSAS